MDPIHDLDHLSKAGNKMRRITLRAIDVFSFVLFALLIIGMWLFLAAAAYAVIGW